jgi:tRNA nucleotidyltransferase/poly(A) polymerase
MATMLKGREMVPRQRVSALKGKYPNLSDQEVQALLGEGFQKFMEAAQPTIIDLEMNIPDECVIIAKALVLPDPEGTEVYGVGGSVRDSLFGKAPKDFDLTCNLSEEEIVQRCQAAGLKVAEKESDTFGVVFVHTGHGEPVEVAPFRADIGVADGRRPDEVQFGVPIEDDAKRRDFTMNSLYYDFGFGRYGRGKAIDFNPDGQGFKDIKGAVVRPVGNPSDRFMEDRFRIMRLLRFFSRYNGGDINQFLDDDTAQAINQYGDLRNPTESPSGTLDPISGERIQGEFVSGLMQSQNTAQFLSNCIQTGLMKSIFPNLNVDVQGIERVGNSKNPKVVLAWLLRDNQNVSRALNKLKYPAEITGTVQFLIDVLHFGPEQALSVVKKRDSRSLHADLIEFSQIVGDPMLAAKLDHLGGYEAPQISGQELMQQGFEGPAIGDEQRRRTTAHYTQSFQDFLRSKETQV